jgi:hypothetical protein
VGKFEAITEGSTGSENRIPQAQRANFYAEVNGASGAHCVREDNMKPFESAQKLTARQFPVCDCTCKQKSQAAYKFSDKRREITFAYGLNG